MRVFFVLCLLNKKYPVRIWQFLKNVFKKILMWYKIKIKRRLQWYKYDNYVRSI